MFQFPTSGLEPLEDFFFLELTVSRTSCTKIHKVKFKKWNEQILEPSKELEREKKGCSNIKRKTHIKAEGTKPFTIGADWNNHGFFFESWE